MASYLDQFLNKPRNPQAYGLVPQTTTVPNNQPPSDIFSGLYNRDQIVDLESQYTNEYGIQNTRSGIASDARHMAAMNNLSNTIAGPINNISPSLGTFIGDSGAFLAGGLSEIGALGRGFNKENLGEIGEDIVANFKGSFGTPNSATAEDIYSQVFSGAVPQKVASGTPMGYGAAQAAEIAQPQNLGFRSMVDMNNDVQNFDNQFVSPDRFNNMGQMGPVKSNMNAPAALDMERFAGVSNLGRNDMDVEQVEQLGSPSRFQGFKNKIGSGLNSLRDFAMNKGNIGRNLIGSAGAMAMGLPGIVGSGAMSLLGGLGNMFEDRQISGDGTIVDEYGNSYTADQLNMQNAKGGYYTDAARSSRRRTGNIARMLQRQKNKGLTDLGRKKLKKLQAQEAAQEEARQAATTQMAAANKAAGNTGGYQAGYDRDGDFMGGSGTAAEMGSSAMGGIIGHGGMGGKPAQSGLASMFTRRR